MYEPWRITNHFGFSKTTQSGGVERIGGRSESILSSVFLSLWALICCRACPLTDVFIQRSGPGSHAAATPPDTQPIKQQQLNKHQETLMLKPEALLSAIPASISSSSPTSISIDFVLVTLYQQPNWQLPFFVWKESQASLQAKVISSPIDCDLVLWWAACTGDQLKYTATSTLLKK